MAPQYASKWKQGERQIEAGVTDVLMFILTNAVSIFASWLSWNCSTQQGLPLLPKLAWAALAFCFGALYVLFYAFKHRNACMPVLPYTGY